MVALVKKLAFVQAFMVEEKSVLSTSRAIQCDPLTAVQCAVSSGLMFPSLDPPVNSYRHLRVDCAPVCVCSVGEQSVSALLRFRCFVAIPNGLQRATLSRPSSNQCHEPHEVVRTVFQDTEQQWCFRERLRFQLAS